MNVKEVIELDIEDSGMEGEGVAHADGKTVFVPYTLKGERVRAVVKLAKPKYATASVIKVLSPSPHRVEPDCPHYFKCGGCDMMHVSQEYRRAALISDLKNNLKKIAALDFNDIGFVESASNIRNKISMPFAVFDGKVVVGLYKYNTHDVLPLECRHAGSLTRRAIAAMLNVINAEHISVYDGVSGVLRHVVVREAAGSASLTLVINADGLGSEVEKKLCDALPDGVDFFVSPNKRADNVIMGSFARCVKGGRLNIDVLGVKARLSPLSFLQVNDYIRDRLYVAAMEKITSPTLIDLYSGIGITSNLAAKKCKKVLGCEVVPAAVEDANKTAALNGNAKTIFNYCGKVENVLPKLAQKQNGETDMLLDPPRKGCGQAVMSAAAFVAPKNLIYISCNSATMCRDVKLFTEEARARGTLYSLTSATVFDMFPYTHHYETLICLERI